MEIIHTVEFFGIMMTFLISKMTLIKRQLPSIAFISLTFQAVVSVELMLCYDFTLI